jgi:hypothetical protein
VEVSEMRRFFGWLVSEAGSHLLGSALGSTAVTAAVSLAVRSYTILSWEAMWALWSSTAFLSFVAFVWVAKRFLSTDTKKPMDVDSLMTLIKESLGSTFVETIDGRDYLNETVNVDGRMFTNCRFTNVTLNYDGIGAVGFVGEKYSGTTKVVTRNQSAKNYAQFLDRFKHQRGFISMQRLEQGKDGKLRVAGPANGRLSPREAMPELAHRQMKLTELRQQLANARKDDRSVREIEKLVERTGEEVEAVIQSIEPSLRIMILSQESTEDDDKDPLVAELTRLRLVIHAQWRELFEAAVARERDDPGASH